MTRFDKTILWAVAGVAIALALWVGLAYAQSGLSIPGDLAVTDDATVGDNLDVDGDSNVDGTSTMSHHSSSYLPQRTLIVFSEAAYGGKAFPDTVCGMPKRLFFIAPCDGLLYDMFFGVEAIGSGWDSLLVDVFAGAGADTSMLDTLPMLIPGDGTESSSKIDGRAAVMDAAMRNVDAGERIEVWAMTYGTCTDGPTGLTVYGWFQPDYGN